MSDQGENCQGAANASVKMRLGLWLESEPTAHHKVQGPLFHRFLPDGRNDAVYLTPEGDAHEIRVWFDRSTKNRNGFLYWDRDGTEFDEAIMRRQAMIEGGNLKGEMLMPDVSDEELTSLYRNPKALSEPFGQDVDDDPVYLRLGKRVIGELHPRLANFIATLRDQCGQYWLGVPQAWDSRRETLGTYCSSILSVLWWNERTQDWRRFLPTNRTGAGFSIPVA